ncbi:unnamed protein product, partial [Polarella glacialis]
MRKGLWLAASLGLAFGPWHPCRHSGFEGLLFSSSGASRLGVYPPCRHHTVRLRAAEPEQDSETPSDDPSESESSQPEPDDHESTQSLLRALIMSPDRDREQTEGQADEDEEDGEDEEDEEEDESEEQALASGTLAGALAWLGDRAQTEKGAEIGKLFFLAKPRSSQREFASKGIQMVRDFLQANSADKKAIKEAAADGVFLSMYLLGAQANYRRH